jgi:hypothetical protein
LYRYVYRSEGTLVHFSLAAWCCTYMSSYTSHSHPKITHIHAFATVRSVHYQASLHRGASSIVDVNIHLLMLIYMFILSTFLTAWCNHLPFPLDGGVVLHMVRQLVLFEFSRTDAVNLMAPFSRTRFSKSVRPKMTTVSLDPGCWPLAGRCMVPI